MKYKKLIFVAVFLVSAVAFLGLGAGKAFAATKTWDGEGADKNFNTAANWDGDAVPSNGDTLVFPIGSLYSDTTSNNGRDLNNDMTSLSVAGIQFTGSYPSQDSDYYEISGNALTVTGDITSNSSSKSEAL